MGAPSKHAWSTTGGRVAVGALALGIGLFALPVEAGGVVAITVTRGVQVLCGVAVATNLDPLIRGLFTFLGDLADFVIFIVARSGDLLRVVWRDRRAFAMILRFFVGRGQNIVIQNEHDENATPPSNAVVVQPAEGSQLRDASYEEILRILERDGLSSDQV